MATQKKVDVKCVLLGRANVGKTCLVERFLHDRYSTDHAPTVGAAFGARDIMVGKKKLTLGIWDTAGSERYESMTRHYYHKAQGAVVCHDLTDAQSFEKAKFWVRELNAVEDNVIIALVGTKADLIDDGKASRAVPRAEVAAYARSINATCYETSALTGKNVDQPFTDIVKQYATKADNVPQMYDPNVLVLSNAPPSQTAKKGCC